MPLKRLLFVFQILCDIRMIYVFKVSKLLTLPIIMSSFQFLMKPIQSSAEKHCLQRENRFLLICSKQKRYVDSGSIPLIAVISVAIAAGAMPHIICFFFFLQKYKVG